MKPLRRLLGVAAMVLLTAMYCNTVEAQRAPSGGRPQPAAVRAEPKPPPAARRQAPPPEVRRETPAKAATAPARTYQTYTKTLRTTGQVYVGRTSGTGSPGENVLRRDGSHAWTRKGYGPAQVESTSASKDAIRGREQALIEKNRQAGIGSGQINGVSPRNPKRDQYMTAAKKEFGKP